MEYTNWITLFFSTDDQPIDEITELISKRNLIYQDKYMYLKGKLLPYDIEGEELGFIRTDWAISECPPETEWLLVTNGDNEYSPKILSYLDGKMDGCAFDFFTRYRWQSQVRYHQSKRKDLKIFPEIAHDCYLKRVACADNGLLVVSTDLGSTIWKYSRWKEENVSYSKFTPSCCHDGEVAEERITVGWVIKVIPYCLFSHSPNIWANCRHGFQD